ncbi:MAG: hypothetical protein HQK86_14445 [Nitrospinae bacterium]|nr:hypothetical protein [Nitrospinota bacterium]MBF0633099.1 hypothetical protein [Nitrospinota bacterium]
MRAIITKRMKNLTRREKALVISATLTLAWFAVASAIQPAIGKYTQKNFAIALLESEIERIGSAVAGLSGLEKKLEAQRARNGLLREKVSKLSDRLKSSNSAQGGGLDFLQSIVNGANLSVAEINISSEPVISAEAVMAERHVATSGAPPAKSVRINNEPQIVRSKIVLKVETGFRELAALVNRIQSTHLPLVVRRLDVAADTPGYPRVLKMEIEMEAFSL